MSCKIDSFENDSDDNFKAAFERLVADRIFTDISVAVTECLQNIYADSNTEMLAEGRAKADAAKKFLDDAARGRRPWQMGEEECADQHPGHQQYPAQQRYSAQQRPAQQHYPAQQHQQHLQQQQQQQAVRVEEERVEGAATLSSIQEVYAAQEDASIEW